MSSLGSKGSLRATFQPFWFADALARETDEPLPPLHSDISVDVCIVGGGFTGLWTALQLKELEPELDIVIVEKSLCGAGASGRNGGCLLTWSAKYFSMQRLYGREEAARLITASELALYHIRDFCEDHRIDAQIRLDGALYTASNKAQIGAMAPVTDALGDLGLSHWEHWTGKQVQIAAGSRRHLEGYYSPHGGSVHPGFLVRGLRRAALQKGIRIFENSPMTGLDKGHPASVATPNGRVCADKVVLALNAWMPRQFPAFNRAIVLVSSDMAITGPGAAAMAQTGLRDGKAVIDSAIFAHYYRTTPDGRLMMGKGGNLFSYNNRLHPAFDRPSEYEIQLRHAIDSFFPDLCHLPIERTWTGPSDRSVTGLPFFGHLEGLSNIVYGLGYSGNGVGQSYVGGQFLSAMVLDQDNDWTRSGMAKGPLGRFPPEPIRWLGAMMVRNAIRRKERAEDCDTPPRWADRQLAKFANSAGKSDKS